MQVESNHSSEAKPTSRLANTFVIRHQQNDFTLMLSVRTIRYPPTNGNKLGVSLLCPTHRYIIWGWRTNCGCELVGIGDWQNRWGDAAVITGTAFCFMWHHPLELKMCMYWELTRWLTGALCVHESKRAEIYIGFDFRRWVTPLRFSHGKVVCCLI